MAKVVEAIAPRQHCRNNAPGEMLALGVHLNAKGHELRNLYSLSHARIISHSPPLGRKERPQSEDHGRFFNR